MALKGEIMSKQVPESDQLGVLQETVTRYAVIRKYRGKLDSALIGLCPGLVETASSPTEFCSKWDEVTGEIRVIGNVLAQLKRDGLDLVYTHLVTALSNNLHRFPFEDRLPLPTTPVTLIMLDPQRTLTMLRWLMLDHWMSLNGHLDGQPTELTTALFESFPTLENHSRERRRQGDYEGGDLRAAFRDTVYPPFGDLEERLGKVNHARFQLGWHQWNDHVEISEQVFAYLIEGDQATALSLFSREQQRLLGSWQINVPEGTYGGGDLDLMVKSIGLHPENEHEAWSHEYPDWVSTSTNHGMGAILFGDESGNKGWCCKSLDGVSHKGDNSLPRGVLRFRLSAYHR